MRRAFALLVAVTVLAGCKGSGTLPPLDPFGRTIVEPPPTGAAAIQPPSAAVAPGPTQGAAAAPAAAPAPPSSTGATPATPASAPGYAPPGGNYEFNGKPEDEPRPMAAATPGDRISIPVDARDLSKQPSALAGGPSDEVWASGIADKADKSAGAPSSASGRSPIALAGSSSPSSIAGREPIVRTIPPRPSDSAGAASGQSQVPQPAAPRNEPAELPQDDSVINIMDLPAAGASRQARGVLGDEGVRLVSAIEPVEPSSPSGAAADSATANAFSVKARYDRASDYGWLRGQLEYSQIDQRWKLRYIPVYGEMDDYGGSVLITNVAALSGYERGDFVEIHGQLDASSTDDRHFTPEYEVRQIQHLAN